jgi:hypothetical protein
VALVTIGFTAVPETTDYMADRATTSFTVDKETTYSLAMASSRPKYLQ